MKNLNLNLTVVLTLLITSLSFAQDNLVSTCKDSNQLSISEKALCRGSISYLNALNSNNEGMMESAMTNIMIMKLYFPERDYDKFISKLSELTTEGESKQVRFKAFIACNYLKHPERYNWIEKDTFQVTTDFFKLFSEKLAKQLEKQEDSQLVYSE